MTRIKFAIFVYLVLFYFLFLVISKVFDLYFEVDSQGWQSTDTIGFEFEIDSENILYNTLIGLRNNNDYLYANIFLL